MKIKEIKIGLIILNETKPAKCNSLDVLFDVKKWINNANSLIYEYNEIIKDIMISYNVPVAKTETGEMYYIEGCAEQDSIEKKLDDLSKKEHQIEVINIDEQDFKTLVTDLNMENIMSLSDIFIISKP